MYKYKFFIIRKIENWQLYGQGMITLVKKPFPSAEERHDCHSKNKFAFGSALFKTGIVAHLDLLSRKMNYCVHF